MLGRQRMADSWNSLASQSTYETRHQSRWAVFLRMICKVPLIHTHIHRKKKRESSLWLSYFTKNKCQISFKYFIFLYSTKPTFLITTPHHMALLLKPIFYNSPLVSSIPAITIPFLRLKHSWQTCSVPSQFFSPISVWSPFLALH